MNLWFVGAVWTLTLMCSPAFAEVPADTVLSVVRTPHLNLCPDAVAIAANVVGKLGRNPFTLAANAVKRRVEVLLTEVGTDVQARVWMAEGDETAAERTFHGTKEECQTLGEAVALAVALLIDPLSLQAEPSPPPPAAKASVPVTTQAPDRHASVAVVGVVSHGLLPQTAYGVGTHTEIALHKQTDARAALWQLQAGALVLSQVRAASDSNFAFGLAATWVGLCRGWVRERWRVTGCANLLGGLIHAVTYSPAPTSPGDRLYVAGQAHVCAGWRLWGPVQIALDVGLVAPVVRHRFFVEGTERTVFQPSAVGGHAGLGLGVSFQ